MPLRHSRPAQPRSTANRTTSSHGSPAAAVSSTAGPRLAHGEAPEGDAEDERVDARVGDDQVGAAAEDAERESPRLRHGGARRGPPPRRAPRRTSAPGRRRPSWSSGASGTPSRGTTRASRCLLHPVPSLGRHVDVVEIQVRQRRRQRAEPVPERRPRVQEDELAPLDEAAAPAPGGRRLERLDPDLDAEARRDPHQLVEKVPVIHPRVVLSRCRELRAVTDPIAWCRRTAGACRPGTQSRETTPSAAAASHASRGIWVASFPPLTSISVPVM